MFLTVAAIGCLAGVGAFVAGRALAEKHNKKDHAKARAKALEIAKKTLGGWRFKEWGQETKHIRATMQILEEILEKPLVVDTSVWMDNCDKFWDDLLKICLDKEAKIYIPSAVQDEIVRLRADSSDKNKQYHARCAHRRLLDFSNNRCIEIVDVKKVCNLKAYADPEIITLANKFIRSDKSSATNQPLVSIITNDDDLIIRARHILDPKGEDKCRILSMKPIEYSEINAFADFLLSEKGQS